MKNPKKVEDNAIERENPEESKETEKKSSKKNSQAEVIQEALGLTQEQIEGIEKKLFIARFLDYLSEETFDFIYKDEKIEEYKNQIEDILETFGIVSEEDKLLQKSFEEKDIFSTLGNLKENAEKLAEKNGVDKPVETKLKRLSLIVTFPVFGVLMILVFLLDPIIILPFVCLFCMVPNLLRGYVVKKWTEFKESHKKEFFMQNRDDILVIKGFINDVLANVRTKLLDWKVPLQLIKFVLHSSDYENLKLINQKKAKARGTYQYVFTFDYPNDVEPFPIPEQLKEGAEIDLPQEISGESETNFVVLTNIRTENGKIKSFVPTLKDNKADEINKLLDESYFEESSKEIDDIIPDYPEGDLIYCVCGEVAEIEDVRICIWEGEFKYYLFVSKPCECGEQVYALSLIDERARVPQKWSEVF
ncbi:MAG: hypothetical protein ACOC4M_05840 [Promethearchaeia archaeon]